MARTAGAYQYVVVIDPTYWLLIGDVPLSSPFDTSLNASNSPAGTATLSCATTSTSTTSLPLDPFGLKSQSVAKRQCLPTSSGKLRPLGFDCLLAGDSTTFRSGVISNGSPFSVPEISIAETELISQVRFGFVEATL